LCFFADELADGDVGVLAYTGVSGSHAAARVGACSALLPCSGGTRYFDSVVQEVKRAESCAPETTVIVATDGLDTSSTLHTEHTCREAVERFRSAGGRLVYLGMADTALGQRQLEESARKSGVVNSDIAVGGVLPLVKTMRSVSAGGSVKGAAFAAAEPGGLDGRSRSLPPPTLVRQSTHR